MTQDNSTSRKPGRPRVNAVPVQIRMPPDALATLDAWIAEQPQPLSRPEAIRIILAGALKRVWPASGKESRDS